MKPLLRLYPRSWRRRYGPEMDALLEEVSTGPGVAMDLLLGAASAYGQVIRGNRILSGMGAYVHGVCIAVLLQAIGFVSLIMYAQGRGTTTDVAFGPVRVATVTWWSPAYLNRIYPGMFMLLRRPELDWAVAVTCVVLLGAFLVLVLRGPRWVRTAQS